MSTILKALRRVEQEKTQQVQRPLREEVAEGSEPRRRLPILVVAAAVFVAGLALGAAMLFLWPGSMPGGEPQPEVAARPEAKPAPARRTPTPSAPAKAARTKPAREKPARPKRDLSKLERKPPVAAQQAQPEEPAEAVISPEVQVVRRIAPVPLEVEESAPAERAPRPGEIRPAESAFKPKDRSAPPPEPRASRPEPSAAPPPAPVEPKPVEPEPARVAAIPQREAPAPTRAEPEPEPEAARGSATPVARSPVPVVLVSRTLWHPRPERREAVIEVEGGEPATRRVHEGDAVGPLVVRTIEPSGVIFEYEGVELRHAVGSDR